MQKFIKLTLLVDGKEEPALIDMADIHAFRKAQNGIVMVYYKQVDPADGLQWNDAVKELPKQISDALAKDGIEIITL
jgi:hypothetical protein